MKMVVINDIKYNLITNYKDGFEQEETEKKLTDYFYDYDYVIGDWAYGKLRLKGFYDSKSKNCKKLNDIAGLDYYIENNCAYGCRHFVISKVSHLK